jgi:hypothetical protein
LNAPEKAVSKFGELINAIKSLETTSLPADAGMCFAA